MIEKSQHKPPSHMTRSRIEEKYSLCDEKNSDWAVSLFLAVIVLLLMAASALFH